MTAAPETTPLVRARGLTRTHARGGHTIRALDDLTVDIDPGEFLMVCGVSGSGKSTLLHLLGGLDSPTDGELRVGGRELRTLTSRQLALYRRSTVGFVFQGFHLIPSMTAEQNVALALTLDDTFGEDRRTRVRDALDRVGLGKRAQHRPTELSGGEQQRVALARALVRRPPLLLADEPTGNLDRHTSSEVMDLIREVREDSETTVVMVTHDDEVARRYGTRIIALRDGRLVGTAEEPSP